MYSFLIRLIKPSGKLFSNQITSFNRTEHALIPTYAIINIKTSRALYVLMPLHLMFKRIFVIKTLAFPTTYSKLRLQAACSTVHFQLVVRARLASSLIRIGTASDVAVSFYMCELIGLNDMQRRILITQHHQPIAGLFVETDENRIFIRTFASTYNQIHKYTQPMKLKLCNSYANSKHATCLELRLQRRRH